MFTSACYFKSVICLKIGSFLPLMRHFLSVNSVFPLKNLSFPLSFSYDGAWNRHWLAKWWKSDDAMDLKNVYWTQFLLLSWSWTIVLLDKSHRWLFTPFSVSLAFCPFPACKFVAVISWWPPQPCTHLLWTVWKSNLVLKMEDWLACE